MTVLALPAHAKVNLTLRVVGRRPDGYHEIDTVFHELDLHDLLVVEPAAGLELVLDARAGIGMPVAAGDDNLVLRAARAYRDATGAAVRARFTLRKRIPAGGGLGGGSADAAAALRLLDALHGDRLGLPGLHPLAARLGADVAFFLRGGTQRGTGIGDVLTPLPHEALHFVLLFPPFGTATAEVYKNVKAELTRPRDPPRTLPHKGLWRSGTGLAMGFSNDLEEPAMTAYPDLDRLFRTLAVRHPDVRMSGSGSTLFLVRRSAAEADALARTLAWLPGEGVRILRTRSRRWAGLQRVARPLARAPRPPGRDVGGGGPGERGERS